MSDLLDPNPFAASIMAEKGNPRAHEIYAAVGLALDRWEHLEISFGTLYAALVCPTGDTHIAIRAFGTISAPVTKREMILAALDAYFASSNRQNQQLKARGRHLLNLYQGAASRRNEIAHAMVMGYPNWEVVENEPVPLPTAWFLVPSIFSTRKFEMQLRGPKYRMNSTDIGHLTACFEELGNQASKLMQDIRAFYTSLQQR